MGAGVSIDVPWFDGMYGFFNGVIEPSQCRQMLGRVRAAIPRTIWCRKRGQIEGNASFLPEEIKSHLFAFHRDTSILIDVMQAIAGDGSSDSQLRQAYDAIWNSQTQAWDNPHLDRYCNLVARQNYGLAHLASELRRQLLAEGHLLMDAEGSSSNEEGLRVAQIKRQLPQEAAQAIALAQDIPLDSAIRLKQQPNLNQQQRHQIARALLRAELPGVELSPDFIYKAVTKDRRKWLNAHKLFWYYQHPAQVKVRDRREWLDYLWQFTDGAVYLPDIRTYSLQVKVLQDIGLFDSIDLDNPEQEYSQEDEVIQQLLKRARRRSKAIYTAFHLKVTSKSKPIQFVNRLLGRVGLRLQFHRQIAKGERFYRLDLERLNDPDRIAVLDSLTQKWEQGSSQPSQQEPVKVYKTEPCCEAVFPSDESKEINQPESAQVASVPAFSASQHQPVEINNTGSCCEWIPASEDSREINQQESAQVTSAQAFGSSQHQPVEINNTGSCCDFSEIPEAYRADVLEMGVWLAEAARETPETLADILDVAVEYLRCAPPGQGLALAVDGGLG